MGNKLKAVSRCPPWCNNLWLGQQSSRVTWYRGCGTRNPSERGTDVRGIFHGLYRALCGTVCEGPLEPLHPTPKFHLSSPACKFNGQVKTCLPSTLVILGKLTCPQFFILTCVFSHVCLMGNPLP